MPELPEVETVARTLAPHVCGRRIIAVEVLNQGSWQGGVSPQDAAKNHPVIYGTGRRGKLLLLYLAQGGVSLPETEAEIPTPQEASLWPLFYTAHGIGQARPSLFGESPKEITALAVHLRMTGNLFVYERGAKRQKHTRVIFELDNGKRVFFNDIRKFGEVRALCAQELEAWDFWQKLGPEPLEINKEAFAARFSSGRAIKALLLEQSVVAGVGNIYADESLFRAGIHPSTSANTLSQKQLAALHSALVEVLLAAIRDCGSSIRDYRTAKGDVGSFQNKFFVYGRAGERCLVCQHKLASARVAGRATVWCPHCQT